MNGHLWKYASIQAVCIIVVLLTGCGRERDEKLVIGIANSTSKLNRIYEGFKAGLRELGYREGKHVEYVYDGPLGPDNQEKLDSDLRRIVDMSPDLIFTIGTGPTQWAQQARGKRPIPIVFAAVDAPVKVDIIDNRRRPGRNTTGISYFALNEPPRLQWLAKLVPEARRLYLPCNSESKETAASLESVVETAGKFNLELVMNEVRALEDVKKALREIPESVDAVYLLPDAMIVAPMREWVDVTIRRKLPLSVANEEAVEMGALMSYGFNFFEAGRNAARLADHIIRGTPAGDLPVATPDFFLTLNLETAEAIGLDITETVLRQAGRVIR